MFIFLISTAVVVDKAAGIRGTVAAVDTVVAAPAVALVVAAGIRSRLRMGYNRLALVGRSRLVGRLGTACLHTAVGGRLEAGLVEPDLSII